MVHTHENMLCAAELPSEKDAAAHCRKVPDVNSSVMKFTVPFSSSTQES